MEERQLRSCKATVDEMCVIFKFEFFTRYKNHVRADVVGNDIVPSLDELADQLDAKGPLSERQEKETQLIRDFMSLSNAPSVDDVAELISLLDSAPRMERNANVHKYPPVFVNYFTGVDRTIPRTREFRGKEKSIHLDCVALRKYLGRNPGNGLDEDLVRFGKQAEIFEKGSIKALNTRDYTGLPAWD